MSTPYTELLAGTQEVCTTLVPMAPQGTVAALTPLMFVAGTNLYKVWDNSAGTAIYLTTRTVETGTAGNVLAQVYKTGIFNIDAVNWPDSGRTNIEKLTAFSGVGVSVQPLNG
ncbi:head decoration protein [Salmonella enterica subsp. enterica serovar Herston]|uniref:Head decoration protein n=1 Tax=Salmonella enterica TaxID=28901 RepID=A0A744J4Q8_SALER|nr:head decoration protein [Salmonella enterica]EAW1629563.1 head decoration protein [Salmonella enterica subsp. enterica]EBY1867586.1 head decoration protein [Salmonella enterica subsp. enterica serovar Durham]EBY7390505.1 head decoration protein [Salmonella enterica subsp. enterica serovar Herston]ECT8840802.1 head decoration protein [Salmonella enterica subsp. enterica serovar Muenchen]EDL5764705.1 head decoration protein [Salmonella enterica subsp. enterica serovar Senftenberg]EEA4709825.